MHSVSWTVTDSLGSTSGVGSRYFTVANSADAQPPPGQGNVSSSVFDATAAHAASECDGIAPEAAATPVGVPAAPHNRRRAASLDTIPVSEADVTVQRDAGVRRPLPVGGAGVRELSVAPTERLELALKTPSQGCEGTWAGYLVKDDVLSDLPVGASLDPGGTFYWQPGPGFAGHFSLLFVRTDCQGKEQRLPLHVTIANR